MKFKVGNKVRIAASEFGSVNEVGDVGIIVEHVLDEQDGLDYRVFVNGRTTELGGINIANWHHEGELELIQD